MYVSQARVEANRRNAEKSTGPRTAEGKAVCRGNALKHNLCATVLVPEDPAILQQHAVALYQSIKPFTDYEAWQIDRAAVCSVRIERCERMERRIRDRAALRAELNWDGDRRLEAEILGELLPRRPAQTLEHLRRTPHGCEWLMTQWAMLAYAADTNPGNAWTVEQSNIAFNLLGTPQAFRGGRKPGVELDFEGRVVENGDDSAAVARRMIAELKEHREVVRGLDEVERTLVEADMVHDSDPELRRLRRYESALYTRLKWSIGQCNREYDGLKADPALYPTAYLQEAPPEVPADPKTTEEIAAEGHPASSPHPPFCLEPDEYPPLGQKPDIEAILTARQEKRLLRSDALRDARRRRVEQLRA